MEGRAQRAESLPSGVSRDLPGPRSGRFNSLQLRGGGGVEEVLGVGVLLEEGSGDVHGHGALDGLLDDGGLLLAPGHEAHLLRTHDGRHTHGDGGLGNVVEAAERGGGVGLGEVVERHLAGDGRVVRTGLVEADVARAADAENLEVEAATGLDLVFVGLAVGRNLLGGERAAGEVHVLGLDVDVIEQVGVHEVPVGLHVLMGQARVLVEVEGRHVGEGEALLLVEADQLGVEGQRRGARGEAQHNPLALGSAAADELGDFSGQFLGGILRRIEDFVCHSAPIV